MATDQAPDFNLNATPFGVGWAPYYRGVNGQDVLEQPCSTIDVNMQPAQVLQENAYRETEVNKYSNPNGIRDLRIEIGDLLFIPRTVEEISRVFGMPPPLPPEITEGISSVQSGFASFNGKRRMAPGNLYMSYKFLGVSRSPFDFEQQNARNLDVAAAGVMNWINRTTKVVQPGELMTWMLDDPTADPAPPMIKRREVRDAAVKGIFCPIRPLSEFIATAQATVAAAARITPAEACEYGMKAMQKYRLEIVGTNAGMSVRPGEVGQIILGW
jgi:hypothetical protein